MPDLVQPHSGAIDGSGEDVTIREICGRSYLLVAESRVRSGFGPALAEALGFKNPPEPCRCAIDAGSGDYCVWYSRHRWFLSVGEGRAAELMRRLEVAAAKPEYVAVTYDVTGGLKGLSVAGRMVRRLLNKGSLLNLEDAAFPPGTGTRTSFVQDSAFIVRPTQASTFDIFYDRSFDHAVTAWCGQVLGRA